MDCSKYLVERIDFHDVDTMKQSLDLLRRVFHQNIFTEKWWYWKYVASPFGQAVGACVRVADSRKIVAIRIAWKWEFISDSGVINAFQMVDTVTDPVHQGHGLFTKATRYVLEMIGDNLIFNFPNHNSAPLNEKMGWKELANIPWLMRFTCISFAGRKKRIQFGVCKEDTFEGMEFLNRSILHTHYSTQFLKWRFANNPINKYMFFKYESSLIIYRIDKRSILKIATIMFFQKINSVTLSLFSSMLFKNGIYVMRYNAYNDSFYNELAKQRGTIKIKGEFRYFMRNKELNNLVINTGDTDFL